MITEENIVYQILDKITGGNTNADERYGERYIRSLMRVRRASLIAQSYNGGLTVPQFEFQSIPNITFIDDVNSIPTYFIPDVIFLHKHSGIKIFAQNGDLIPILSKQDYQLSLKNPMTKFTPKIVIEENKIQLFTGNNNIDFFDYGTGLSNLKNELETNKKVNLELILANPDDAPNYNWTTDQYPLSSELISKLKRDIIVTEFSDNQYSEKDEVTNGKRDSIRYHDQSKID